LRSYATDFIWYHYLPFSQWGPSQRVKVIFSVKEYRLILFFVNFICDYGVMHVFVIYRFSSSVWLFPMLCRTFAVS